MRAAGNPAELDPKRVQGRRAYGVRIAQLSSKEEADALAVVLTGMYGVSSPRVTQEESARGSCARFVRELRIKVD